MVFVVDLRLSFLAVLPREERAMPRPLVFAVFFFAIFIPSCTRETPTTSGVKRLYVLDPQTLHRSFLDRSDRWQDQRISVTLKANSYAVNPPGAHGIGHRAVVWCSRVPTDPPDVVFDCPPPSSSDRTIVIQGVCRGVKETPSCWYVSVEECVLTVK